MSKNMQKKPLDLVPEAIVKATEEDYSKTGYIPHTTEEELAIVKFRERLEEAILNFLVVDTTRLDEIQEERQDSDAFNELLDHLRSTLAPTIDPDFLLKFIDGMEDAGIFGHSLYR